MKISQDLSENPISSTAALHDLERELATAREQLGAYHLTTISLTLKLATTFKKNGNSASALDLCVTARNLAKDAFFTGHQLELESLCLMAEIYQEQGLHEVADEIKSRVLTTLQNRGLHSQAELTLAIKLGAETNHGGTSQQFFESLLKSVSLEKVPLATRELLLAKMGNLYYSAKNFDKAKDFYNSLFYLEETKVPPYSVDIIDALMNLASIKIEEQDYLEAREVLRKSLRKAQALETPQLEMQILSRLIEVSNALEKTADTIKFANLYSKLCEEFYGSESEEFALALVSLGTYACELAQFGDAQTHLEQAVSKLEQLENPAPLVIAEQQHNLAVIHFAQTRTEQAFKHILQALDVRQSTLGEQHEDTILSKLLMCRILVTQTEFEKAQELLRDLLPDIATTFSQESAEYLDAQKMLRELGSQKRAAGSFKSGVEQQSAMPRSGKDDHLELIDFQQAVTLFNQASVMCGSGDYSQAFRLLKQVLPVFEGKLGSEHPELLPILQQLEGAAYATGNTLQAQECYRRIQAIKKADVPA